MTANKITESREMFDMELLATLARHEKYLKQLMEIHNCDASSPRSEKSDEVLDLDDIAHVPNEFQHDEPSDVAGFDDNKVKISVSAPLAGDNFEVFDTEDIEMKPKTLLATQGSLASPEGTVLQKPKRPSKISNRSLSSANSVTALVQHDQTSQRGQDEDSWESLEVRKSARKSNVREVTQAFVGTQTVWWRDLDDPEASWFAYIYSFVINPLIFVSVAASLFSNFDEAAEDWNWLLGCQLMFDVLFTIELIIRFGVSFNMLLFFNDAFNVIDIVAAVPIMIVRITEGFQLRPLEPRGVAAQVVMGLMPVLRICKVLRRFQTFHLLMNAFSNAMEALPVLMFVFGVIGLVFASLIYVVEPRYNIDTFGTAIWLTVITMTTTGYGDKIPVTTAGKFIVGVLVVIQGLYLAMPLGILGQEFTTTWKSRFRFWAVRLVRTRMAARGLGLRDVPAIYDQFADQEGDLDFLGFTAMVRSFGVKLSERRMREVYQGFDEDGGGNIDELEFVMAVFPNEYRAAEEVQKRRLSETQEKKSYMRTVTGKFFSRLFGTALSKHSAEDFEKTFARTRQKTQARLSSISMTTSMSVHSGSSGSS